MSVQMRQACAVTIVCGALAWGASRVGAGDRAAATSAGRTEGGGKPVAPLDGGAPPAAPIELPPARGARPPATHRMNNGAAPSQAATRTAVARAAGFLARFPEQDLRFDAALLLTQIRAVFDSDELRAAFARARAVADHDADNPMRRFWLPDFRSPPGDTAAWAVPQPGQGRVNTNRVVAEALHCAENGLREETVAYLCGAMRDGGGYQSTHALWALELARRAGCAAALRANECRAALQQEILAAAQKPLVPQRTGDLDLYAERLVLLNMTGVPEALLAPHMGRLVAWQSADGSWGRPAAGEQAYFAYHATGLGAWALAEWTQRTRAAAPAPAGHATPRPGQAP